MRTFITFLFCVCFCNAFSQADELQLERAMYNLPNVTFKKISEPGDPFLKYDLSIKQPIDHSHPEKGFFNQRVLLTHKGFDKPTVIETQGYSLNTRRNEIEKILGANNLNVEYRFFGNSIPDSIPWEYLKVEQAMGDLHAINQLFRNIYKGKWVSTGISKGGSTTIYYKYFYPDDVDLSIPYVAPLDNSLEDKRIYAFLDTMGTTECRNKIKQLQLFLLDHENEALEKLKWYSKGAKLNYNYTGSIGRSFEYSVLEYPFSFWQYIDDCSSIPSNNNLDDYLQSLLKVSDISSFADEGIKPYEAHYYQASTECGYYGYNIEPFKGHLHYFTENPSSSLPPKLTNLKPFDPTLNQKVQKWLDEKGNNLLYIYGGYDTWTAAGITVTGKVNSKRFLIPKTSHSTARIKNMDDAMKSSFEQSVKLMSGMSVNFEALK